MTIQELTVPLQLEVCTRGQTLLVYPLPLDRPISFGRCQDCDITVTDRFVTRRHCMMRADGAGILVRDLGSTNGTRVRGQFIAEETRIELDGVIQIADTRIRLAAHFPLDPLWLAWDGGQILELAEATWACEDETGLPILADALEEAGCNLPWVLDHLRGGDHEGGCFVLERLLSVKERMKCQ